MRPDPPRRKDGRCALPGCDKTLTVITAQHRRYKSDVEIELDPFCSTEHCRLWHDVPLRSNPMTTKGEK